MSTDDHLADFSKRLTEILQAELKAGNEIAETSNGWPHEKTIMVFLKKPFIGSYHFDDLEFREINDPHWWKAEFYDKATEHILACKYE